LTISYGSAAWPFLTAYQNWLVRGVGVASFLRRMSNVDLAFSALTTATITMEK